MTSSNQLAVFLVEFGNASPALLQLLLQSCGLVCYLSKNVSSINTKSYYMYVPNMYLLKHFILSVARKRAFENWHKGVSMSGKWVC